MPLYAYRCNECEHQFETRQRFTDAPLSDCPRCGGPVRRVINRVGLVFKGSGFYVNDSRNGKSNGASGKANGKSTSAEKSSEAAAPADSSSSDAAKSSTTTSTST